MTPNEERLFTIRNTLKEAERQSYRFSFTNDDIKFLLQQIDDLQYRLNPPQDWEMS